MAVQTFLSSFHIGAASGWDIFIIIVFLLGIFIYGFFLGRNRMIVLLLSTYFSLAIIQVMPWEQLSSIKWLGLEQITPSFKIFIFLGMILLFFFLIPRSALSSTLRIKKRGDASWLYLFLLSAVQIGLFAAMIFSFLPKETINDLAPLVKKIFIGPEAQFIWITLPILVVVLTRRRRKIEE